MNNSLRRQVQCTPRHCMQYKIFLHAQGADLMYPAQDAGNVMASFYYSLHMASLQAGGHTMFQSVSRRYLCYEAVIICMCLQLMPLGVMK